MVIIKSENIHGRLTHWIDEAYAEKAIHGEFRCKTDNVLPSKPVGLWLSWNGGWEEWCNGEWPDWMKDKICLTVKLKHGLNIWLIDELEDFLLIWEDFKNDIPAQKPNGLKFPRELLDEGKGYTSLLSLYFAKERGLDFWDWLKNKHKIDGVAITSSGQNKTRYTTWLYGWDAQSIIIFNPNGCVISRR